MNIDKQKLIKQRIKGFTLIEMVIVILLVGIMAAIAIPKFVNLTSTAKQAAYDSGLGALRSTVSIYLGENQGVWPTANSLAAAMEGTITCTDNNATYGGVDSIVITDIEGAYQTTAGSCATSLSSLDQIAIYTSSF